MSIIQISAGDKVYIIFFNRIGDEAAIKKLLSLFENGELLKLGQAFKNDLRNIIGQLGVKELTLRNYVDVADLYVDLTGSKTPALDKMCLELFSSVIREAVVEI